MDNPQSSGVFQESTRCLPPEENDYTDCVLYYKCSLVQANPDVAMDCIIHMSQNITPSQRAKLSHLLATMDSTSTS